MTRPAARLLLAGTVAWGAAVSAVPHAQAHAQAPGDTPAQRTELQHQRVLASATARRARATAEDRAAARQLVRDGDRAYRRGDYAHAFTAYANAYPNAPLAYAYVMAGDAHWREVARHRTAPGAPAEALAACPLENRYFAHDLAQGLAQQQRVGLALAEPTLRTTWWYLRAHRATDCLQDLAARAARQPDNSCADLAGLRACLGPPLPPP